jgi:hypothetical protein
MRKEINKNEARKKEDERRELQAKQQREEQKEKNKKLGKVLGKSMPTFYSNDAEGREIFVQTLSVFPSLVPRVGKTILREDAKSRPANQPIMNRTQQLGKPKRPSQVITTPNPEEAQSDGLQKNELQGGYSPPTRGLYESITPTIGVTFTENGRNPKANNVSLSRHFSKISRAEFNTLKTETLEYNMTSNSRLMPDPGLSKSLASRTSGCTHGHSRCRSRKLQTGQPTAAALVPISRRVFRSAVRTDSSTRHTLWQRGREWGHPAGRAVRQDNKQLFSAWSRLGIDNTHALRPSNIPQIVQADDARRSAQA